MKKLLILAIGLIAAGNLAFAAVETVYLKNGSVIKGEIIEQVPSKSIKIQTKDGSIFVYSMDEVERITKEADSQSNSGADCNVRHRKLDFSINTGYNIATKGGNGSVPVDITLSKRFSPYFSAGIGAGVEIGTASGSKPIIPMFASFRGFMPLKSKVTPFAEVRVGYALNTADDYEVGSGRYRTTVEMPDYVMFSVMPGIRIPLSHTTDLDLGLGYEHMVATGGGSGTGAVMFKVGFNFHANQLAERKPKKTVPTYDSGLEFGFEGGGIDWGGALLLGYKLNSHLSFALGGGYGWRTFCPDTETEYISYKEPDFKGEPKKQTWKDEFDEGTGIMRIFIRGQYRLTDRRFSPIATIDLGYRKYSGDSMDEDYFGTMNYDLYGWDYSDEWVKPNCGGFFVRPQVGVSLRIGSNSYLEAKVGYDITNSIKGVTRKINSEYKYRGRSVEASATGKNLSALAFSIGWKHTFKAFGR